MRTYEASYRVRTNASGMIHGTGGSIVPGPLPGWVADKWCRAPPLRTTSDRVRDPSAAYNQEAVL